MNSSVTKVDWATSRPRRAGYVAGLVCMGLFYIAAGTNHFVRPAMYLAIMPPYVPAPLAMIYFTGVAEVLGGIGVLIRRSRSSAAWGLVALLLCIWPAHFNMLLQHESFSAIPVWALWLRLALQIPLILWARIYTRNPPG